MGNSFFTSLRLITPVNTGGSACMRTYKDKKVFVGGRSKTFPVPLTAQRNLPESSSRSYSVHEQCRTYIHRYVCSSVAGCSLCVARFPPWCWTLWTDRCSDSLAGKNLPPPVTLRFPTFLGTLTTLFTRLQSSHRPRKCGCVTWMSQGLSEIHQRVQLIMSSDEKVHSVQAKPSMCNIYLQRQESCNFLDFRISYSPNVLGLHQSHNNREILHESASPLGCGLINTHFLLF